MKIFILINFLLLSSQFATSQPENTNCIKPSKIKQYNLKEYRLKGKVKKIQEGIVPLGREYVIEEDTFFSYDQWNFDEKGLLNSKFYYEHYAKENGNWKEIKRDKQGRVIELETAYVPNLTMKTIEKDYIPDTSVNWQYYQYKNDQIVEYSFVKKDKGELEINNKTQYSYNKKGCLEKKISKKKGKKGFDIVAYKYNKKGLLVYSKNHHADQPIPQDEIFYTYEKKRLQEVQYFRFKKLKKIEKYKYLPSGNCQKLTFDPPNYGNIPIKSEITDKENNVKGYSLFRGDTIFFEKIIRGDTIIELSKSSSDSDLYPIKEETILNPKNGKRKEFRKFQNHQLISEMIHHENGSISSYTKYNTARRVENIEKKTTYQFDKFGNWILQDRIVNMNGELNDRTVLKRIIEYFE